MDHLITKEQFDLLFNGNNLVFFMKKVKDDYEYVYLNNTASSFMNNNAVGRLMGSSLPDNTSRVIRENYDRAIETGHQIDYADYSYYLSEIRKYETSVKPIFHDGETFVLAITKEIKYERDFEDKFIFMRSVFSKSYLSTVVISNKWRVYEANTKFADEVGLTIEEMLGQSFLDLPFIPKSGIEELESNLKQVCEGVNLSTSITNFTNNKGETLSYLTTFTPIMREQEVIAIFLIFQDITSYIKKEQELRKLTHGFESFKAAMDSAAEISITDNRGIIIDVNEHFLKTSNYEREELIGRTHSILNSNYHSKQFFADLWNTLLRGEIWRGEICNRSKFGQLYWVESTVIPLKNEEGTVQQFLSINKDISDKKQMMAELENIANTFNVITENANDLIVVMDKHGDILYATPSYVKQFGYTKEELQGLPYKALISSESQEKWSSIFNNNKLNTDHYIDLELLLETKDGQIIWTEGHLTFVNEYEKEEGAQFIMVSREITKHKELEEQLKFMAYHDSLTLLPNRRYLLKEFPELVESSNLNEQAIALLYIDGDDFKSVNDTYGHEVGDEFIKQFAFALSNSIRAHDMVVRIGGDEFIIVLTGLKKGLYNREIQLKQIINRIRMNLMSGWSINGNEFAPTSSMGIAYYPDHAASLDDLMILADRALYEAKSIGKNSIKITDKSLYS